jgi:hypothetical protein
MGALPQPPSVGDGKVIRKDSYWKIVDESS